MFHNNKTLNEAHIDLPEIEHMHKLCTSLGWKWNNNSYIAKKKFNQ